MSAIGAQLKDAWINGARRKLGFKPTEEVVEGKYDDNYIWHATRRIKGATAHLVPKAARIFKVGDDAIVVTDGTGGYMPFCLSALRELLKQVEAGPTVSIFRCDQ